MKTMAKDQASSAPRARGGLFKGNGKRPAQAAPINAPERDEAKPKFNPIKAIIGLPRFLREVRAEARKITWPSWRETWITSIMVSIMVVVTSVFFVVVDWGLSTAITWILKLGGGS